MILEGSFLPRDELTVLLRIYPHLDTFPPGPIALLLVVEPLGVGAEEDVRPQHLVKVVRAPVIGIDAGVGRRLFANLVARVEPAAIGPDDSVGSTVVDTLASVAPLTTLDGPLGHFTGCASGNCQLPSRSAFRGRYRRTV